MAERNVDSDDSEFIATWCIQLRTPTHPGVPPPLLSHLYGDEDTAQEEGGREGGEEGEEDLQPT